MTLHLPAMSRVRARRPRIHRASPILEDLEGRLVLNAAAPSVAAGAAAEVQAPVKPSINSLIQLTNFTINSISVQAGQLVASATATLDVLGHTVTETLNNIPLTATGTPSSSSTCDVLNLSLGPVNLDLLGLDVSLDNCANGPVTVSITGSDTGVLGTLVCDLANALNGGTSLGSLLNGLTSDQLSTLESGLTDILNGVIGGLLNSAGGGTAAGAAASAAASTDPSASGATTILDLDIPNGLHVSLLGLNVDTSAICLDVTAVPGPGNLLGNLLGGLSDLLNNTGNDFGGISALEKDIINVLNGLGL